MKERLKFFGALALLWILFFGLARILFLLYQFTLTRDLNSYEIAMPLWLGLRMDLAMAAYWLILPGLALVASFFVEEKITRWILSIIFYVLAIFTCSIVVADLELYRHWGFRMDTTPLLYTGSEGVGSVSSLIVILLLGIFIVLMGILHWAYGKFIRKRLVFTPASKLYSLLMFFFVALLFIPIRSSFRVAPLNTGVVYFHTTKAFPNHAGVNVVWNFLKSVWSDNGFQYPSDFMETASAQSVFAEMMKESGSTTVVINQPKPNVLLIILESFTANILAPLGGMPGITPNLNQLCSEGILFDAFYASGDRTDKGLISILSGYPAQPKSSIIKYPKKTENLPSLPKILTASGYHTSFVYGGDIGFANMESYLTIAGFSHITEDNDFDLSLNASKWGVHDQYVFNRVLNEVDTASAPFFKTMLSLSSHEPFDVPFGNSKQKDETGLFLNACTYTDSCLGQFIRDAKQKDWWKNTLVIITADHGHSFPYHYQVYDKQKFKIPMLWLGGAVDSTFRINKIGSQTDLANTLLAQLNVDYTDFIFSKNMLAPKAKPFAVYAFNNGFGYVDPNIESVYDFDFRNYLKGKGTSSEAALAYGKAYMQILFNDYNKR